MSKYWLMKSEPDTYSIDDLKRDKKSLWDGVRNYQARNIMRDEMNVGDKVLFYHSRIPPMGVYGLAEVSQTGKVDPSAFNKKSKYFDPKSKKDEPRWICVEVRFISKFETPVTLDDMKKSDELKDMMVLRRGARLSVQPVSPKEYQKILKMAEK